jgi:lipoprotein-anchoring transpeptidase ErfK/SrfK
LQYGGQFMLDLGTAAWWNGRLGGVMSRVSSLSRLSAVLFLLAGFVAGLVMPAAPAQAASKLRVEIDLSSQTMRVDGGFFNRHNWRVSTARPGYRTPVGKFRPIRLERIWYSSKYENSPMPYSIFFLGGYAIHGTYEVKRLGRAVSHGCVRLAPNNARTLFQLVKSYGRANTVISIRH